MSIPENQKQTVYHCSSKEKRYDFASIEIVFITALQFHRDLSANWRSVQLYAAWVRVPCYHISSDLFPAGI